mgnify:CR=1 FL=1
MMGWVADRAGTLGLVIFFTIFVVAVIWTFAPKNKQKLEQYGNIPLRETKDN